MRSLYAYNQNELNELIASLGEKSFRANQIWKFLYDNRVGSIEEMHNLPKALRSKLSADYCVFDMMVIDHQSSKDGGTKKFLIKLRDSHQIEVVLMRYHYGYSVCISSQVGCAMGCSFCASTIGGLARHLEAYEIWQQILLLNFTENIRISNVVLMGSGEPLHNYENVLKFIKRVNDINHLGIGHRHITLSTCGIVSKIDALANEKLQITLAVSLHSPFDDERTSIVPANKAYGLMSLIKSIDRYIAVTGKRVSIEYTLISGKNDTHQHANELIKLFRGKNIHINLIPLNVVKERDYIPTDAKFVAEFRKTLEKGRLNVTVRRELGDDIDAACGQLRRNYQSKLMASDID